MHRGMGMVVFPEIWPNNYFKIITTSCHLWEMVNICWIQNTIPLLLVCHHLNSDRKTVLLINLKNRLCIVSKITCRDILCNQTNNKRFKAQVVEWMVFQMDKVTSRKNSKECPRYSMTIIYHHIKTRDKCIPMALANRIFELKISDQMVPLRILIMETKVVTN